MPLREKRDGRSIQALAAKAGYRGLAREVLGRVHLHLVLPDAIYCHRCGQPVMRVRIGRYMASVARLTPEQIAQLSGFVSQYITVQRGRYAPRAVPLSAQQKAPLEPFFAREVLDSVRALVLHGERVPNPEFYPMLRGLGIKRLPDQSAMGAITFCDVVVSHEPFSDGLLFHELVHVEQYRLLGIPRFSELYVRGFLKGGGYEAIPLEGNAYTLSGRFEANPRQQFSVQDEVRHWNSEGRL
jgi:hypothetical protein